jgi:hypothetical protein
MTSPIQQAILDRLAEICELSDDVRFGQMVDFLGFLAKDATDHPLADVDDDDLLRVLERHRDDLARRLARAEVPHR